MDKTFNFYSKWHKFTILSRLIRFYLCQLMLDYLQILWKGYHVSFLQYYKVHISDQASLKGENTKISCLAWYILIDHPVSCLIFYCTATVTCLLERAFLRLFGSIPNIKILAFLTGVWSKQVEYSHRLSEILTNIS